MESVAISDCDSLSLNLTSSAEEDALAFNLGPIDIEVSDVGSVELTMRNADRFLKHLFMDNVAYVETFLSDDDGSDGVDGEDGDGGFVLTTEELYLYIIIVLGSLLVITWTAIPVAIACSKSRR